MIDGVDIYPKEMKRYKCKSNTNMVKQILPLPAWSKFSGPYLPSPSSLFQIEAF